MPTRFHQSLLIYLIIPPYFYPSPYHLPITTPTPTPSHCIKRHLLWSKSSESDLEEYGSAVAFELSTLSLARLSSQEEVESYTRQVIDSLTATALRHIKAVSNVSHKKT